MIYLKTFEGKQDEKKRLKATIVAKPNIDYIQKLIDEYLAYIKDEGYKVLSDYVYYDGLNKKGEYYSVKIFKGPPFDIIDIYDDLLQFIELMDIKGYLLIDCEVSLLGMKAGDRIEYSAEDVIKQKINNCQIMFMYLNFDKKIN